MELPLGQMVRGSPCNITYNCLDRHVKTWRKNKVALIWVGEDDRERIFTYGELLARSIRCANALKKLGLNRRPRHHLSPENSGTAHCHAGVRPHRGDPQRGVFEFSAPALASRINDAESKLVITADVGFDRTKVIPLKPIVDEALKQCSSVERVVVVRRQPSSPCQPLQELDWADWVKGEPAVCEAKPLDSETPLYILYVRHDRKTQGGRTRPRRVHGRHLHDDKVRVRHER